MTPPVDTLLICSLYLFEMSAALLAISLHKKQSTLAVFLRSHPGVLALLAVAGLIVAAAGIVRQHRRTRRSHRFAFTVMLNVITSLIALGLGEVTLRALTVRGPDGPELFHVRLLPLSWPEVAARNRRILDRMWARGSYLVYDSLLGWTVAPSAASENGLYFSSVEGIRSEKAGARFSGVRPKYRIALVGDSFTFGLEVKYADSWGHQLERALGPDFQVLNFGVDGYGLDQTYLRYGRDVRSWHPDAVVIGVFSHDFERTMTVYSFNLFSQSEMPFSKPRFAFVDGKWALLNVPTLSPASIFAKASIAELPWLDFDEAYDPPNWQAGHLDRSYIVRFAESLSPVWSQPTRYDSEESLVAVNSEILRRLNREVRHDAALPIFVYLPGHVDLQTPNAHLDVTASSVARSLAASGISYTDVTPQILEIPSSQRLVVSGHHYTAAANAAVAKEMYKVIKEKFAEKVAPERD